MIFNYEFSRNWWGFRWLKWVFDQDFAQNGTGFCPIFHILWITILFSPFIIIIKGIGWGINRLGDIISNIRFESKEKMIQNFIKRCSDPNITSQEAREITNSKCWKQYNYRLDYDVRNNVSNLSHEYWAFLYNQQNQSKERNKQKYRDIKESKWFTPISYVVCTILLTCIGYLLYNIFKDITFRPIDWPFVWKMTKGVGIILGITFVGVLICVFIIDPIVKRLKCTECKLCKLGIGKHILSSLQWVWGGVCIIGDMIYLIYKQACPVMTIKDEKNN